MKQRIGPPLVLPTKPHIGTTPFEGDVLDRKEIADLITSYFDQLKIGSVIGIDAPWGEGKSWFGENWKMQLEQEGHKVAFIDAFKCDYLDDPFLPITSELSKLLDSDNAAVESLANAGGKVMRSLLPVAAKGLVNVTGRIVLGTADISEQVKDAIEAINNEITDSAAEWLTDRIKNYEEEKSSLESFREKLRGLAAETEKPVVIFIDELDRCRPDFAVKTLERIKHFFDVPNIVFILLMNRQQLEAAIKGLYGEETDASLYLSKFINIAFSLPKSKNLKTRYQDHVDKYVLKVFRDYGLAGSGDGTVKSAIFMAKLFNLSLRDTEKMVTLYIFSAKQARQDILHFEIIKTLLLYVIAMKLSKPYLLKGMLNGDSVSFEEASALLNRAKIVIGRNDDWQADLLNRLYEWHVSGGRNYQNIGENFSRLLDQFYSMKQAPEKLLEYLSSKTDLPFSIE